MIGRRVWVRAAATAALSACAMGLGLELWDLTCWFAYVAATVALLKGWAIYAVASSR